MAEQTLLTMVQNILSSLDSDEVNSISDTQESRQVANIVQNKYYDLVSRGFFPEHNKLVHLDPSNDPIRPTLMYVPAGVSKINWIKYFDSNVLDGVSFQSSQFGAFSHDLNTDLVPQPFWTTTSTTTNTISIGTKTFVVASSALVTQIGQGVTMVPVGIPSTGMTGILLSYDNVHSTMNIQVTSFSGNGSFSNWTISGGGGFIAPPGYIYVTILPITQFLDYINRFNPVDPNVGQFQFNEAGNNFTFYYMFNHQPRYCTIISDKYVIFDMFDGTQDTTLQSSKTMVWGQIVPPFQLNDSFIPPLDDQEFPLLLNEAKALAWLELRQMPHPKADQEIQRQWSVIQKIKSVSNKPTYFQQLPDFGRVPRTGGYSGGGYGVYKWMRQAGP